MHSQRNTTRRTHEILAECPGGESVVSAFIPVNRALLPLVAVLPIMDAPSSSPDAGSEYEISSGPGTVTGDRKCICISHRLSEVRNADRNIVPGEGMVAGSGTHDELLASGGKYHSMFTGQK
jgi:ABC-type multidrug transport system fused ATPase/permease subunit